MNTLLRLKDEQKVMLVLPRHRAKRWRKAVASALIALAEQQSRVTAGSAQSDMLAEERATLREVWQALSDLAGER